MQTTPAVQISKPARRQRLDRIADKLVFVTGLIAAVASVPQTISVWTSWSTQGISLPMLLMFWGAQLALTLKGWTGRIKSQLVTVGLTACSTTVLIVLILLLRSMGK